MLGWAWDCIKAVDADQQLLSGRREHWQGEAVRQGMMGGFVTAPVCQLAVQQASRCRPAATEGCDERVGGSSAAAVLCGDGREGRVGQGRGVDCRCSWGQA